LVIPDAFLELQIKEQHIKLYIIPGVPTDALMAPQTRKEISDIKWVRLVDLPGYSERNKQSHSKLRLYMVTPFLFGLRKWIEEHKKADMAVVPCVEPAMAQVDVFANDTADELVGNGTSAIELQLEPKPDLLGMLRKGMEMTHQSREEVSWPSSSAHYYDSDSGLLLPSAHPYASGTQSSAIEERQTDNAQRNSLLSILQGKNSERIQLVQEGPRILDPRTSPSPIIPAVQRVLPAAADPTAHKHQQNLLAILQSPNASTIVPPATTHPLKYQDPHYAVVRGGFPPGQSEPQEALASNISYPPRFPSSSHQDALLSALNRRSSITGPNSRSHSRSTSLVQATEARQSPVPTESTRHNVPSSYEKIWFSTPGGESTSAASVVEQHPQLHQPPMPLTDAYKLTLPIGDKHKETLLSALKGNSPLSEKKVIQPSRTSNRNSAHMESLLKSIMGPPVSEKNVTTNLTETLKSTSATPESNEVKAPRVPLFGVSGSQQDQPFRSAFESDPAPPLHSSLETPSKPQFPRQQFDFSPSPQVGQRLTFDDLLSRDGAKGRSPGPLTEPNTTKTIDLSKVKLLKRNVNGHRREGSGTQTPKTSSPIVPNPHMDKAKNGTPSRSDFETSGIQFPIRGLTPKISSPTNGTVNPTPAKSNAQSLIALFKAAPVNQVEEKTESFEPETGTLGESPSDDEKDNPLLRSLHRALGSSKEGGKGPAAVDVSQNRSRGNRALGTEREMKLVAMLEKALLSSGV
jgi:hypothetical protein